MSPAAGIEKVKKAGSAAAHSRGAKLFGRNTVASIVAFTIDIALLFAFVEWVGLSYLVGATVAFLIAMTVQYVISRIWVFSHSDQGLVKGYVLFLLNAGVGLVITLAAFAALLWWAGLHYLIARLIASAIAGIAVFFLNAVFNFKEL
ncbi:MAG: GtrA family protein [Allosphingosinicella sp.]|uniref:GtrA family protein n=1 Tax=Allosphingosinicella sp. TaxID=2823234 RepID=UPI003929429D